ncbi:MAG: cysteine dioxygenase family protein [Acidobacteria bacterium]|nr:cysteine dioxygenase family protein [Acidobacteriota bacterium]
MSEPECISIDELRAGVQALLEAGQREQVSEYLNAIRIDPESLAPYLHFNQAHYTRNLVFKNELFEMLVLCWDVGHRSWIHNHRGEHCWMGVTRGTLAVRNFKRLGCDQQLRTMHLEPMPEFLISPGSTAKVDPAEPVHVVWNPVDFNRPAVSLHIYSLPFDTCVVYDTDQGLCRDISLFYTSEYGVLTNQHQGGRQLADIPACACTLSPAAQGVHCGPILRARSPEIHPTR